MKPPRNALLWPGLLAAAAAAGTVVRADVVPVPAGAGAGAVIQANGPLTTVNLIAPSVIQWQDFTLGAGRELRYVSPQGAAFPSLNLVRSPSPALVDGRIVSDGPFYLVSPGGVQVGTTGRIEAPRVLLSTLQPADEARTLSDGTGTFLQHPLGGAIGVDGTIETSGGPLVILSPAVSTGGTSKLRAPGGDIRIAAVDSAPVNVSPSAVTPLTQSLNGSGLGNTTGWIEARRVEIVSDGFLVNGGRIMSAGQGDQVRLTAPDIAHESRPDNSSVILTSSLTVNGRFRQVGAVINPNDGANPAVAAGLRQTPRLSTGGFISTVEPGQTQLSHAPLQSPQTTASAVPPPVKRAASASSLAARRRGESDSTTPAAGTASAPVAAKPAPAGTGSNTTVKKASFFGQRIRH